MRRDVTLRVDCDQIYWFIVIWAPQATWHIAVFQLRWAPHIAQRGTGNQYTSLYNSLPLVKKNIIFYDFLVDQASITIQFIPRSLSRLGHNR